MISKQASVATAAAVVAYPTPSKQDRFTCICCRIKFDSTELQRAHFKSEWHLYNLKRKICNLDPIDLDSFNEIQAASPAVGIQDDEDYETSSISESSFVDLSGKSPRAAGALDKNATSESFDEEDWVHVDGEEFVDEDYDDDEADELLARVISSDTCLFCDKKGSNLEDNTNHMNLMHGFFIPEEKYMIDHEGFMEYLGFKVGAGATCLWCNKQFTTVQGVRLHMINKNHCKILYDQQNAVDEFKEFYDYSSQKQFEMKPINELVVVKRHRRRTSSSAEHDGHSSSFGDSQSAGRSLIKRNGPSMIATSCQARASKKFHAGRAKILLKTASSNNKTLRARFRHQNPI